MLKNVYVTTLMLYAFSSGFVYAMNNNNDLKSVKTAEDTKCFADKVMAYQSAFGYFDTGSGYKLTNSIFNYGYVNGSISNWVSGPGFQLYQLLPKNGVSCNKALTTKDLATAYLWARDINAHEAQEIIGAIASDKALFSYCWGEDQKKIMLYLELVASQKK